jgi:hypothetical protein
MSKTKRLVHQLKNKEFNLLYKSLVDSEAQKSADLLHFFRQDKLTDEEIKQKLDVNSNAYYTLRSRLNEKIEDHILHEVANPQTDILRQVAGINEILFTKSRIIALASLKKLEKELKDYDLSNELTLVYRALKKLNIHHPKYYEYSQLYNKHVAYMISVDKVEDNLADYFKRYSEYTLDYSQEDEFSFEVLIDEISNISTSYESHRMFVYKSLSKIFHQLYVEKIDLTNSKIRLQLENDFVALENIFKSYKLDTTYHNLFWVVKYLKVLYYHQLDENHKGITQLLTDISPHQDALIANYGLFTFSGYYYNVKLTQYRKANKLETIYEENKYALNDLILNPNDVCNFVLYYSFLAVGCYYNRQFEEGLKHIQYALNEVSLVNHTEMQVDLKLLECLFFYELKLTEELKQTTNNIRRHIRLQGKTGCIYANEMLRVFNSALSDIDSSKKKKKICKYIDSFNNCTRPLHSPIYSIYLNPITFGVVCEEHLK